MFTVASYLHISVYETSLKSHEILWKMKLIWGMIFLSSLNRKQKHETPENIDLLLLLLFFTDDCVICSRYLEAQ